MRFSLQIIVHISWLWSIPAQTISNLIGSGQSVASVESSELNSRIIGGLPARAGQFPFAAALLVTTPVKNSLCGGALISNQWVLTGAHCVDEAVEIEIRLGSNSLLQDDFNRVVLSTANYFVHPEFNATSLENDIALIKFRDKIEFSDYIGRINLPVAPYSDHVNVTTIGWGQTHDSESAFDDHLNCASVITLSNEDCQNYYGDQITKNIICATGQSGEGICTGDSGNPLVYLLNNRHPIVIAVATFFSGFGCETFVPSGYTRVYPYREWILNVTENLD